ncbi:transmembrane and death domain protein 1-like isoform X2 [Dunckerocampus dactyliophorus]|uniref:transmembrane and death domain protein 1-like isoform X2 n=1 Tax=Dunckerocampus dactyliophorus TaxID=161453 RepID=UPI00240528E6|nr:transmembrane and death domain protein 1-like isoform X2 [Dunckerocampus dactyliophorus]
MKRTQVRAVVEDIGVHQLERLVELLTSPECEELLVALSNPEKNIFQHVERLSEKNNELLVKHRITRDTASLEDSEAKCRADLTAWLEKYGPQTYYDRLLRALHHIGRADIALEVGKNINQDKILNLERYVEGYHQFASSLKSQEVQKPQKGQKRKKKRASDLTWHDLDLIVLQPPVPAYTKGPLDVALPLLYGILLGFGGTLLAAVSTLLAILRITNWNRTVRQPRVVCYPSWEVLVEN